MNPYETLGITPKATLAEVKLAHRHLIKICHPDKGGDQARFAQVQAAYECLSDKTRRANYDRTGSMNGMSDALADAAVAQHVAMALIQILNSEIPLGRTDVRATILRGLAETDRQAQARITQCETALRRIEEMDRRFRKRSRSKAGRAGAEMIKAIMDNQRKGVGAELEKVRAQLAIQAKARMIFEAVDYDFEQMVQTGFIGVTTWP